MTYEYPMWFKDKDTSLVVKFDSIDTGVVVVCCLNFKKGYYSTWDNHNLSCWINVTDQYAPPKCQHEISFDDECVECDKLNKIVNVDNVFFDNVSGILEDIKFMLFEKNQAYGNSALNPIRIFSKADNVEQLKIRIDDKLSRISRGNEFIGDDTINDLIGYLVLFKIAKEIHVEK